MMHYKHFKVAMEQAYGRDDMLFDVQIVAPASVNA
jgi:hypothetical protein